ncbi:restriction endonuclease subunit S, partial [Neobacillus sp. YIM B02564]
WEQRKLGEISEKVTEKNKNKIYSETLTNSAEYGIINQRDFFEKDISNEKNLDGYYVVHPDDFVYNPRISNLAPVGPIKRNKLGRTGVMSPLYYVFRIDGVDKTYLEKYFSSNRWHIFMKMNGDSGARSDRFAIKDSVFREMPIPIPSNLEQTRIGNFLKQLDDTITLYHKKLDKLKELKRAYLYQIFEQRLRFFGFSGDWEQGKLGDLAEFSKGNGYTKSDLTEEGKPIILYGRLYTNYQTIIDTVDTFVIEKENSVISKGNEVIVPSSGETAEDISRASVVSIPGVILGGDLNIVQPSDKIDPVFLALTISNGKQQKELSKRAQGKSIVHLHNSDLKEVNLLFPKKEEQMRIGNFFKRFDETIALHQSKIDKLTKIKKGFLQKMFI